MPTIICQVCSAEKYLQPSVAKRIAGKYCSRACMSIGQTRQVEVACETCGTNFMRRRDKLNRGIYCGKPCSDAARRITGGPWCKEGADVESRRAYFRAYIAKNREKINAGSAAWAKANRDYRNLIQQVRRAGGEITREEWAEVLTKNGGQCVHCGTTERLERDHIVPMSKGGLTVPENLQPLCRSCNAAKGNRVHDITITEI